jgi:hypothetical protein
MIGSYCAERGTLDLVLSSEPILMEDFYLNLVIPHGEQLPDALEALTSCQETLTPDNHRELVRQLLAACPQTYQWVDDHAVPLKRS